SRASQSSRPSHQPFPEKVIDRGQHAQGLDGRVDRDTVVSAMRTWDDRRPAARPRVWSVCCHRVELPPQFPSALLWRAGIMLPRAGELSRSLPVNVARRGRYSYRGHKLQRVPRTIATRSGLTGGAPAPAPSGLPAPAQARDIGVPHRVEVDAFRRDQPLRHDAAHRAGDGDGLGDRIDVGADVAEPLRGPDLRRDALDPFLVEARD